MPRPLSWNGDLLLHVHEALAISDKPSAALGDSSITVPLKPLKPGSSLFGRKCAITRISLQMNTFVLKSSNFLPSFHILTYALFCVLNFFVIFIGYVKSGMVTCARNLS